MVERDTRFGGNLELANIGDTGIASLAKQQLDFDRSDKEFARFHAKSDPTAQKWEQNRYELYNHPEFINARSPRVFRNTEWSPNYPGSKFDTRFIVGANKSSEGLRSWTSSDYYQNIRELNKFKQDWKENKIRNMILGPDRIYPKELGTQAGIPATNQGYKVMNASDPTGNDGWIDRLGRWLFNDPYDKESDESLYQGTEEDKLEEDEFPTYDPNNPDHFMMPPEGLPDDFPFEDIFNAPTMEAKIDLQDIFRRYPGIDLWRLIQNLDARGIEYANRGGIIGLL